MVEQGVQSLDNIRLLAALPPPERDQVARACRWKRYRAGEHIIDSQGDSRDVFFIVSGTVRVANYSLSGREVTLDDIPAGGYFGELAALDNHPRSAGVTAVEDTVVAALPPDHFIRLVTGHPKLALAVMRSLAGIVRSSTDRIMDLSTLGANNRVHAEMLRLAKAAGRDGWRAEIKPIPPHADIASRVSTTRETVARVLNDLARAGIVKRERDALQVLDLGRLEALVEDVRGGG